MYRILSHLDFFFVQLSNQGEDINLLNSVIKVCLMLPAFFFFFFCNVLGNPKKNDLTSNFVELTTVFVPNAKGYQSFASMLQNRQ